MVVDKILDNLRKPAVKEHRYNAELYRAAIGGRTLILVKPLTYMNLSGEAVAKIRTATGIAPEEILAIHDCLDLPLGRLRLRAGGGSGGHRGVESLIRELGSDRFPRLRVGIGRETTTPVVDYVLGGWSAEERPVVAAVVAAAADAAVMAVRAGVPAAMNRFNAWCAPGTSPDQPPTSRST
jgi:PTH1 family peptidyl-tRNA hydrolase